MKTIPTTKRERREAERLAVEHPRMAAGLLWLSAAALMYAVFTYDFTTRI